jgi:hypothetical protein
MYFCSSINGEEQVESDSLVRDGIVIFGGSGCLVLDSAVLRRTVVNSSSEVPDWVFVDADPAPIEKTFPKILHFFFESLLSKAESTALTLSFSDESVTIGPFAKLSKLTNRPGCSWFSSWRRIINLLPGVGTIGAEDGGKRPSASAVCFKKR